MSTFVTKLYRVRPEDNVTFKVIIGHGQLGKTTLNLLGDELVAGRRNTFEYTLPGPGNKLDGKKLYVSTVVADVQTDTNETSVTYELEGGVKPFRETLQETVESHGDVVFYTATFRFYV
jgi:hypothetical protein